MASTYANLQAFVDSCPQNDPYTAIIRRDFVIMKNEVPVGDISCTEPYSQMPPTTVTDELAVLQALRFMYYMDMGRSNYLPWTQLRLYDWIKSRVGGIDIVPNAAGGDCCIVVNGIRYVQVGGFAGSASVDNATAAEEAQYHQTPWGLAANVAFYGHEARHTEGNGYPHVTGCPDFPSGTAGCDETYDPTNLSPYAIQYYLAAQWLSGAVNLGYTCDSNSQVLDSEEFAALANAFVGRFVSNPPPQVSPSATSGGPCIPASTFTLNSVPSDLTGAGASLTLGVASTNQQAGWTSDSPDSWISVSSGASLMGDGQAVFTVNPPGGSSASSGTAIAAGQVVSLTCGTNCTLSPLNTITFGPLADVPMGTPPFTVAATASSGLPVAFNSTTGSVCTVSGATVTVAATGICSITATQAGNAISPAATPVIQSFTITGLTPQSITFVAPASVQLGASPFTITATASSGLPVAFTASIGSNCTVSDSTVTIVSAGDCAITASQPGNSTYAAAPPVTETFPVLSSSQMRWSLNAAFEDFGVASGYFVLDTSNMTITDWDIVGTGGTVLPPLEFNPETSYQNSGSTTLLFQSYGIYFCNNANGSPQNAAFIATLASAPTAAGGTINILPENSSVEEFLCDQRRLITSGLITTLPLVNSPTFNPAPGTYTSAQTVMITDSTPNSTIFYTTDGSVPTESSTKYPGSVAISGTKTIRAIASAAGDSDSPVASANYNINLPPNFTFGLSANQLIITSGSQATMTLTITPANGFSAAVTFACSGLSAGATCAFNPSTITPSINPATTTLTVTVPAKSAELRRNSWPAVPLVAFLFGLGFVGRRRRRNLQVFLGILVALVGLGFVSGCGGGGGSGGSGGGGSSTPISSTVTLTATSGSVQQTGTFILTVE